VYVEFLNFGLDIMVVISDTHLSPGDRPTRALRRAAARAKISGTLVLDGDILNIMPYGLKQWRTPRGVFTRMALSRLLRPIPNVIYICGNHEGRQAWIRQLLGPNTHVKICRRYETGPYVFTHGHRKTEWRFLELIADDWHELVTTNALTRRLWYWFSKKMGWMPGSHPKKARKQSAWTGLYWGLVYWSAIKEEAIYVVGHSHEWLRLHTESGCRVIDCGKDKVNLVPYIVASE